MSSGSYHFCPESPNHYAALGLRRDASLQDIRQGYKVAAMQYHPDKNPKAQEQVFTKIFQRISSAYAILSNSDTKSCYDFQLTKPRQETDAHDELVLAATEGFTIFQNFFGTPNVDFVQNLSGGCEVQLVGLSVSELNGSVGEVVGWLSSSQRWNVQLASGGLKSIKTQNLLWTGCKVQLQGLNQTDLNGLCAMCVARCDERWEVKMSNTTTANKKIKYFNLSPVTSPQTQDSDAPAVSTESTRFTEGHTGSQARNSHGPTVRSGLSNSESARDAASTKASGNKHIKFVILGETGSGKTSFLNYISNLHSLQIERAKELKGDPTAYDNWEQKRYHRLDTENNASEQESQTKEANIYQVQGLGVEITAIDTPGLADTNGMTADDKHLKSVEEAILKEGYINCIVLVVNGRSPRQTAQISYVLSRLTSVLPKAIADAIVVVYTRVDCRGFLEFDPVQIEKVIGRPIPEEHQLCFDNPFACVELLKKNAARTGKAMDSKSLKVLKKRFAESMESFEELLLHMQSFRSVDIKVFKELFVAKQSIEEEVVTLQQLLKENAEKQAKVIRAEQDISTAADWKKKMAEYEKQEDTEEWIKVPNQGGTHNMVCNKCSSTCHRNCNLPMEEHIKRFKQCECFSSMTDKKLKINNEFDLQKVLAKVELVSGQTMDVETQNVVDEESGWLAIKDNCTLCGVQVMGDPANDDFGAYEKWVKDIPLVHYAASSPGENMGNVRVGSEVSMRDWSNLMQGKDAKCRTCSCPLAMHGHQTFSWKKESGTKAVINHTMKSKHDKYATEEEQKKDVLSSLRNEMAKLKSVENACKEKLRLAMQAFKEKSTATSYVRVLRTQMEYLDYCKDVVKGDPALRSDVRDARLATINDQQQMLQAGLDLLGNVDEVPVHKPGVKIKTQRCSTCNGDGTVWGGLRTCGTCRGAGQVVKKRCGGA